MGPPSALRLVEGRWHVLCSGLPGHWRADKSPFFSRKDLCFLKNLTQFLRSLSAVCFYKPFMLILIHLLPPSPRPLGPPRVEGDFKISLKVTCKTTPRDGTFISYI